LAHFQEKLIYVNQECIAKTAEVDKLSDILQNKKDEMNDKKKNLENHAVKKLQSKQKIDQINSTSLLNYYSKINKNIEGYGDKIEKIIVNYIKLNKQIIFQNNTFLSHFKPY